MDASAVNMVVSLLVALVLHEAGHFVAARACGISVTHAGFGWGPRLFGVRAEGIKCDFRLLPIGAYIRMDMAELQRRPLRQQLFVLLAGVGVNVIFGLLAWGSFFGVINLALAVGNLFPLYQLDGWKTGMVISRRIFNGRNSLIEWSFTIAAGVIGVVLLAHAVLKG